MFFFLWKFDFEEGSSPEKDTSEPSTPNSAIKTPARWVLETPGLKKKKKEILEFLNLNCLGTAPARISSNIYPEMTPMRAKTPATKIKTVETDKRRLGQRSKQIVYGKSTLGYLLYKNKDFQQPEPNQELPKTPRESQKCSKRCWDAQIREWR